MTKTPKTDSEYVARLERRLSKLERSLLPWQLNVGAYGDLVADNLNTGRRVVIARAQQQPQHTKDN